MSVSPVRFVLVVLHRDEATASNFGRRQIAARHIQFRPSANDVHWERLVTRGQDAFGSSCRHHFKGYRYVALLPRLKIGLLANS
jgi:hypothetical protein